MGSSLPNFDPDLFRGRIVALTYAIPSGCVATYGQLAALAGFPRHARACGRVLRSLVDGSDVPWHRVVNAQGGISTGGDMIRPSFQRALLEAEGVHFSRSGRCSLRRCRWEPDDKDIAW